MKLEQMLLKMCEKLTFFFIRKRHGTQLKTQKSFFMWQLSRRTFLKKKKQKKKRIGSLS